MSYRHEKKYVLTYQEYLIIKNKIKHIFDEDSNHHNGSYNVYSVYFDDYLNTAYLEKVAGIQNRYKYRIRTYNLNSETLKFETKIKNNEYITKEIFEINQEEYNQMINLDYTHLLMSNNQEKQKIYYDLKKHMYKPKVAIKYQREAYLLKGTNLRITFDHQISILTNTKDILSDENYSNVFDKEIIILEIKYANQFPKLIANLLVSNGVVQQSFSKYEYAMKRKERGVIRW